MFFFNFGGTIAYLRDIGLMGLGLEGERKNRETGGGHVRRGEIARWSAAGRRSPVWPHHPLLISSYATGVGGTRQRHPGGEAPVGVGRRGGGGRRAGDGEVPSLYKGPFAGADQN